MPFTHKFYDLGRRFSGKTELNCGSALRCPVFAMDDPY